MSNVPQKKKKRPSRAQQRSRRGLLRQGIRQGRWPARMHDVATPLVRSLDPVVKARDWLVFLDAVANRYARYLVGSEAAR